MTTQAFNELITKYQQATHRKNQIIGLQLLLMVIFSAMGSSAIIMTHQPLDIYIGTATIAILIIIICLIVIAEGNNWLNPIYRVHKLAHQYQLNQLADMYKQQIQLLNHQIQPLHKLPTIDSAEQINQIIRENKQIVATNQKINDQINELQNIITELYPDLKYTN